MEEWAAASGFQYKLYRSKTHSLLRASVCIIIIEEYRDSNIRDCTFTEEVLEVTRILYNSWWLLEQAIEKLVQRLTKIHRRYSHHKTVTSCNQSDV